VTTVTEKQAVNSQFQEGNWESYVPALRWDSNGVRVSARKRDSLRDGSRQLGSDCDIALGNGESFCCLPLTTVD
jgi:hypothetical protein